MSGNKLAVRNSITRLQEALATLPGNLAAEDFKTSHYFAPGLYGRLVVLPAGCTAVGKIHKESHAFVLLKGKCWMASVEGLHHLEAPYYCESPGGSQRAAFTETDCVMLAIHDTNTTDLTQLERELIAPTYNALEEL